jgi:hypothetical protein
MIQTGVTEETLSLQLLGGKLKLENLRIRETALAEIELPVCASGLSSPECVYQVRRSNPHSNTGFIGWQGPSGSSSSP